MNCRTLYRYLYLYLARVGHGLMEEQLNLLAAKLEMEDKAVKALMKVLYEKSFREEQHSRRVSWYCMALGIQLGLDINDNIRLGKIGLLHDVGKISIPNAILDKSGPLVATEWEEIHQHPKNGHRFLSVVVGMGEVAETVLAHHEHFDGNGYPNGLRGQQIPLDARIVAVADAYDAMVSERPYRNPLSREEAVEELERGKGTQFDPEVVHAFACLRNDIGEILQN